MSIEKNEVLIETVEGPVKIFSLNRPERHNAINLDLAESLVTALERAETDGETKVVIVTGSGGKAFCAGQDMLEASGIEPGLADPKSSSAYLAIDRFAASPLPLIAAVNGYCYGGGAALALSCDIRIAAQQSTFRFPGAEYGLVVGAASLPRLVGAARAKEIILTAQRFSSQQAEDWGMVNHVVPDDSVLARSLEIAQAIAANSSIAVTESKRVIDLATMVEEAVSNENAVNQKLRGSTEQSDRFRTATKKVTGR